MSTHNFTWAEDQHGNEGWIMDGHPNFDAATPQNLVHDCLEHLPRGEKHGAAADELLALGARFYLRVASGWWWSKDFNITPPQQWSYELDTVHRDGGTPPPCVNVPLEDEDMEAELQAALVQAVDLISGELLADELEPLTIDCDWIVHAGAWLRTGYRAAQKRYKGTDPLNIMWMAEQLEQELAKPRYRGEYPGERLTIRVHEKDQEFSIRLKELYV